MARGWLRIIAAFVITFDLITIILYQTRDGGQFEEEDDGDEVHRHLLEVGTSELSRFHNETFGTVMRRRQQQLLRLGLDPNPPLVVYNRVPKCGSTTTLDIIRFLKRKLKFHVYNDIAPKMKHYVESDAEELELIQNITRVPRPLLYIRHIFFIDFPKYGFREPLYINIARDPVDLFISNYYYLRFGFQSAKNTTNAQNWKRDMTDERRNMTVDECVASDKLECSKPYSNLIPFFCGSGEVCLKRGDKALEIAKRNVFERYGIVGIMEDFPNTMKAIETVAPRFFLGSSVLYAKANEALHERSKTAHKKRAKPRNGRVFTQRVKTRI